MPEFFQSVPLGMQDEEHARNCRMCDLDYQRCRAMLLDPRVLVETSFDLVCAGMIALSRLTLPKCNGSVLEPYILLTFRSVRNRKKVQQKRGRIHVSYRPHGNPSLKGDDLSWEKEHCLAEAQRRCEALRKKGFAVVQSDLSIRVGNWLNAKWYKYDALEVLKMRDDYWMASAQK